MQLLLLRKRHNGGGISQRILTVFWFFGCIIAFKDMADLCDFVFINHQWLLDEIAMIMHLSPEHIEFHDHTFKNRLFKSKTFLLPKNN